MASGRGRKRRREPTGAQRALVPASGNARAQPVDQDTVAQRALVPASGNARAQPADQDEDILGLTFRMSTRDAEKRWDGWNSGNSNKLHYWKVIAWGVEPRTVVCKYTTANDRNVTLLGGNGTELFDLDDPLKWSSKTVIELIEARQLALERYAERLITEELDCPYQQVKAKRFASHPAYDQTPAPTTNQSKFTALSQCPHCATALFVGEDSQLCCADGKFVIPGRKDNPPELERLLRNRRFSRYTRVVNNMFSMTSIGTKRLGEHEPNPNAQFVPFPRSIGNLRLHGQSYHRCLPGNVAGGIEYYIYDQQYAAARDKLHTIVPPNDLDALRNMLRRENSYVQSIRSMADVPATAEASVVLRHSVDTNELAAFTLEESGDDHVRARDIVFHRHCDQDPTFMNVGSAMYDTLQFPLLHPYGGTTWHVGYKVGTHALSLAQYTKYNHLQDPGKRLQRLGKLTEEILLDNNSRILEERLNFVRHNASLRQRVSSMAAVRNPSNAAQRIGTVYLPHCTPGSPKYQQSLVEDALTIVQRKGHPTYFITFTCNPDWPEIQENLLRGQKTTDRPVLVARVFKLKLKQLLSVIKGWDGGCEYYLCTIEFQHRGLPHAHIAIRVKQVPSFTNNMKNIQTNMPDAAMPRYRALVGQHMIHGCRRKTANELGVNEPYACLKHKKKKNVVLRKCKRGYPKPFVFDAYLSDTGYPVYQRKAPDDRDVPDELAQSIVSKWPGMNYEEICRRVVPHSRELLLMFNAHVNVEWAHSVEIIAYLYKYIYKHESTAWMSILQEGDQVQRFVNAQRVSSSEAAWKILRFTINERSHPVKVVHVHNPGDNWLIYNEAEDIDDELLYREHVANVTVSKLERYLSRPVARLFDQVKLVEYYEQYGVCKRGKVPAYARDKTPRQHWVDDFIAAPTKRMAVYKLADSREKTLVRIPRCSPSQGERFYIRLLLCHVPARSWQQLRTHEGETYRTFEEAAHARNLLAGLDEYEFLFEDYAASAAVGIVTPEKLQQLFVTCMTQGEFPANALWQKHKVAMGKNARARYSNMVPPRTPAQLDSMAESHVLRSISEHLEPLGKTLETYGLPQPETPADAVGRYHLEHHPDSYSERAMDAEKPVRTLTPQGGWSQGDGMTSEQKPIFDAVILAARNNEPLCQMIEARAGRGKTWLMELIVATARREGIIVLCVASTALAATNYRGRRTSHSQLCIPAGDDPTPGHRVVCNLQLGSQHATFLRAVRLIIWDEVYNSNRFDIEAVDRMLRDLMNVNIPFGGKVMVFGGDRRQIPPVIPGAEPQEVARSVISASRTIWPHCKVSELVHPVRDASDPLYSAFVDSLGDNTAAHVDLPCEIAEIFHSKESKLCAVPSFVSSTTDVQDAINFVYPNMESLRDDPSRNRCI